VLTPLLSLFSACSDRHPWSVYWVTVWGFAFGREIEAQMFNFAQKFNRITNVEFRTSARLTQNPCCRQFYFVATVRPSFCPQVHIALMTGIKLFPSSVKLYSTFGGNSLNSSRFISP
jgi:hypothetical protein